MIKLRLQSDYNVPEKSAPVEARALIESADQTGLVHGVLDAKVIEQHEGALPTEEAAPAGRRERRENGQAAPTAPKPKPKPEQRRTPETEHSTKTEVEVEVEPRPFAPGVQVVVKIDATQLGPQEIAELVRALQAPAPAAPGSPRADAFTLTLDDIALETRAIATGTRQPDTDENVALHMLDLVRFTSGVGSEVELIDPRHRVRRRDEHLRRPRQRHRDPARGVPRLAGNPGAHAVAAWAGTGQGRGALHLLIRHNLASPGEGDAAAPLRAGPERPGHRHLLQQVPDGADRRGDARAG